MRVLRGPSQNLQSLIVAANKRLFLFSPPALDPAFACNGISQPQEISRPHQFYRPPRMGIAAKTAGVMLGDALIKSLARETDVIGIVAAAEHIDEDIHGSPTLRQAQGEEEFSHAHCASASRLRSCDRRGWCSELR